MDIKRVIIVGTVVIVMSFGNAWSSLTASASSPAQWSTVKAADPDELLLKALNQPTDEDLYDALYDGKSLQDIASEQNTDIEDVINLQVAQLTEQLDSRLASGSITAEQYAAHTAELRDIVTESVLTSFG
ncbi:hypothetical protein CA600_26960 [Paenibacillus sp. VTT E-133280]|jgi:hypothetical protein|uniref:hypothetical protein n=1 Tax=Paenibacillus TaxID=44249 RepID=UPI000B9FAD86|nr:MULTISPECIES: hypothetical protein [unclassified Paenibacillus]MDH6370753.1 hypothetical protein [Paenibacillus sp. PastF-3]OZQ60883.1 hypothetical protein CA600_26960 [Paenibacillus sp. VTT E-133280]OZQ87189.1 hypothetical protein CA598_17135 [Paenibacillus sp. VTT E-133291]